MLLTKVMAPPLVLSSLPPAMVRVPVPKAMLLLTFNWPLLTVVPPAVGAGGEEGQRARAGP